MGSQGRQQFETPPRRDERAIPPEIVTALRAMEPRASSIVEQPEMAFIWDLPDGARVRCALAAWSHPGEWSRSASGLERGRRGYARVSVWSAQGALLREGYVEGGLCDPSGWPSAARDAAEVVEAVRAALRGVEVQEA